MLTAARKCQTKKTKSPQLRGLKVFYCFTYRLLPDEKSFPLNTSRTIFLLHISGLNIIDTVIP
ncbi:hypothetical protein BXL21_24795 [Salmonella enterica subsp. enterica serovar Enteritidis]|nr:hypothetical protein [Salmonella enterica subsp. enterica serovar Enteritidis]